MSARVFRHQPEVTDDCSSAAARTLDRPEFLITSAEITPASMGVKIIRQLVRLSAPPRNSPAVLAAARRPSGSSPI
jgi:hypothetical protein